LRGLIRQSLRVLRLPYLATGEALAARTYTRFLRARGINYADSLAWTRLKLGTWSDSGVPPPDLRGAVRSVLAAVDPDSGLALGAAYFGLHQRLKAQFSFTHSEAIAFLSQLKLSEQLVERHRFSAARLTRVLIELDMRVRFSRQNVALALQQIGKAPQLELDQVQALAERDSNERTSLFADADLIAGAGILQSAALDLGFTGNLGEQLLILAPAPSSGDGIAYIQMLHYQCIILEFHDHSVLDLYEFSPRGEAAIWLFEQYPAALANAANPFLNNAKSVGTMDRSWVESKKVSERPGATALFNILSGMDAMDYAARRELAMTIRAWIVLFLRLSASIATPLPAALSIQEVNRLIARLRLGNTGTLGIVEQRLLDAVSRSAHPLLRSRGLGDSINATNISRRKLGDCDYQDVEQRRIFAYEAHGGVLTDTYVEEHIRTLRKVVPYRKSELESIADIQVWQATVTFVAHQVVAAVPNEITIDGLRVAFIAITFAELFDGLTVTNELIVHFNQVFLPPLRERRTPDFVRGTMLTLLAPV
jgi:hypothetical protein